MSLGINVGTVHVSINPDFTKFAPAMEEGTKKTVPPVAEKAGAQFAAAFGKAGSKAGEDFVVNVGKTGATLGEAGAKAGSEFGKAFTMRAEEAVAGFGLMAADAGKGFSTKFSESVAAGLGGTGSGFSIKTREALNAAMADAGVVSAGKFSGKFEEETTRTPLGQRLFSKFSPDAAKAGSAAGQAFGREFGSGANGAMAGFLSGKQAALIAFAIATVAATHAAANFESQTAHLVTDAGESANQLEMVRKGMLDISEATGTTADALYQGMYHIESAGYHGAAGLQVLRSAAEGAKVGNADLDVVAKTLTGTMNSYGMAGSQATAMMNQLIATVGSGDMKMDDLSLSLGNVAPLAAAAGIKFSDVAGAIATMTAQNMTADRATQDLAFTIRALQAPTHQASQEMLAIGINSNDLSKNLGKVGLSGTIEELTNAVAKHVKGGQVFIDTMRQTKFAAADAETMISKMPADFQKTAQAYLDGKVTYKQWRADLLALPGPLRAQAQEFASVANQTHAFNDLLKSGSPQAQAFTSMISKLTGGATGMNTTLMLSGERMGVFKANADRVAAAARGSGKDVEGWGIIQQTFNQKLDVAKASIAKLGISVGMDLLPAFGLLLQGVTKVADAFTGMFHAGDVVIEWMKRHKAVAEGLAGALIGIGVALFVSVIPAIWGWVAGNVALAATFIALNAATGGILLAVAALGAGIIELVLHWRQSWDFIKRIADDAWQWIKGVWAPVAKFFEGIWDDIKKPFDAAIGWVEKTFDKIKDAITLGFMGWWQKHADSIKEIWHAAWVAMKLIVDVTIMPIVDAVRSGIEFVVRIFESAIGGHGVLHTMVSGFFGLMKTIFEVGFLYIKTVTEVAWRIVSGIFKVAVDIIWGILKVWWTVIKTGFEVFWGYMKMILKIAWDAIVMIFSVFLDIVTGKWSRAWEDIKNFGVQVWHAVRDFFVNDFVNPIKNAALDIAHFFLNDFWHPISNFFTSTLPGAWDVAVNALKTAWDKMKQYAADPVKWIVQYVYQDGIRRFVNDIAGVFGFSPLPDASGIIAALSNVNGGGGGSGAPANGGQIGGWQGGGHKLMADGGVVPGGWGGGDIVPAMLTPGERVLSLDQVSMLGGHSAIDRLVGAARPELRNGMAYAAGGWSLNPITDLKHIGSNIAGVASSAWDAVTHIVRGAAAGAAAGVLNPIGSLADHTLGTGSNWSGIGDHIIHKVIDSILTWIKGDDKKNAAAANTAGGNGAPAAAGQPKAAQDYARTQVGLIGGDMTALIKLWNQESGWNANAVNPSSGAYGIPQALGHGHPYNLGDWKSQVDWGIQYIASRYRTASSAWAHEVAFNWYDNGGMWPSGTLGMNMTGRDEGVLTPRAVEAIGGPSAVHALNHGDALGGNVEVHVYIGDEEINDHIDVRVARSMDTVADILSGGIKVGG